MSADVEVSLHMPDPQHPADDAGVVEGVADDVLNAQPADDAHEQARREADRLHAPQDAAGATAAAPANATATQTDQVTDDHDYSGASTLERDTGQVERNASPAEDTKDGDGSPESLVADAVDPAHDDRADTASTTPDAAAAPTDDHSATAAPADDHGSSHVDDGSASG